MSTRSRLDVFYLKTNGSRDGIYVLQGKEMDI